MNNDFLSNRKFYSNQWDNYQRGLDFISFSERLEFYYDEETDSYNKSISKPDYSVDHLEYRFFRYLNTRSKCKAINAAIRDIRITDNEKLIIILQNNRFYEKDVIQIKGKTYCDSDIPSIGIISKNKNLDVNPSIYDCKTIIIPFNRLEELEEVIKHRKENFVLMYALNNGEIDCISRTSLLIGRLTAHVAINEDYNIVLRGSNDHIGRALELINRYLYQGKGNGSINKCTSYTGFEILTDTVIKKGYLPCMDSGKVLIDYFEIGNIKYTITDLDNHPVKLRVIFEAGEVQPKEEKDEEEDLKPVYDKLLRGVVKEYEKVTEEKPNAFAYREALVNMMSKLEGILK